MKKQNSTGSQYVTKTILKKELNKLEVRLTGKIDNLDTKIESVEQRLDAKIDTSTQSMKDYTDSRTAQVQESIHKLGEKLDTAVIGIVQMLERSFGTQVKVDEHLENHEQRITKLEEQTV